MKVAVRDINYQFWANAYTTLISFGLFAVLAHFLVPLEFGLYALGTVIATILWTLGQAGFVSLAYSNINRGEKTRNTLFWANILISLVLVTLTNAILYVVVPEWNRRIFLIALVSTQLIASIAEVANVVLLTAQRFRALAAKQFVVQTIGAAAALAAAFRGYGAWSLVIQRLIVGLLEVGLVFSLLRWLPRLAFDVAEFRRLLPSAIGFAGNSSLAALETRLADLVLAVVSTLDQVAAYRIAARVFDSIIALMCQPISSVTSAAVAAEPLDKGAVYLAHVRLLLWVGAVPFAGLLCFGDVLVPLVFGSTWIESGVIAQILAIQFFVGGPTGMTDSALTATGRAKELVTLRIQATLVSAPLIIVFAMMGTKYVALAMAIKGLILLPLYLRATQFLTKLSTFQMLKITLAPYLVAISSACLARIVFQWIHVFNGGKTILALAIGVCIGGIAFAGLFAKFGRPELKAILVWRRA